VLEQGKYMYVRMFLLFFIVVVVTVAEMGRSGTRKLEISNMYFLNNETE
jgi:hypothetical protein